MFTLQLEESSFLWGVLVKHGFEYTPSSARRRFLLTLITHFVLETGLRWTSFATLSMNAGFAFCLKMNMRIALKHKMMMNPQVNTKKMFIVNTLIQNFLTNKFRYIS